MDAGRFGQGKLTQNEKRLAPQFLLPLHLFKHVVHPFEKGPPLWCRPSGTRTFPEWGTRSAPSPGRGGQSRSGPCGWCSSRVGLGGARLERIHRSGQVLVVLGQ